MMGFPRLSSVVLRQLASKGDTINIRWKQSAEDPESQMLLMDYPEAVANTFVESIKAQLDNSTEQDIKGVSKSVFIIGGETKPLKKVLNWIVNCCQTGEKTAFPFNKSNPYTNTYLDREAARILDLPFLIADMNQHMEEPEAELLKFDDFRQVLTKVTESQANEMYERIKTYIGDKVWIDFKKKERDNARNARNSTTESEQKTRELTHVSDDFKVLGKENTVIRTGVQKYRRRTLLGPRSRSGTEETDVATRARHSSLMHSYQLY